MLVVCVLTRNEMSATEIKFIMQLSNLVCYRISILNGCHSVERGRKNYIMKKKNELFKQMDCPIHSIMVYNAVCIM